MPESHPELSRPYFEREARYRKRVIFSWHPCTRWPDKDVITGEQIEGVTFLTVGAAQTFDLEAVDEWHGLFDAWAEAEAWLCAT